MAHSVKSYQPSALSRQLRTHYCFVPTVIRLTLNTIFLPTAHCQLVSVCALRLALCGFRLAIGLGDDGELMKTGNACLVHDPNHRTMGGLLVGLDENLSLIT